MTEYRARILLDAFLHVLEKTVRVAHPSERLSNAWMSVTGPPQTQPIALKELCTRTTSPSVTPMEVRSVPRLRRV